LKLLSAFKFASCFGLLGLLLGIIILAPAGKVDFDLYLLGLLLVPLVGAGAFAVGLLAAGLYGLGRGG
jgi:hypothetical protein